MSVPVSRVGSVQRMAPYTSNPPTPAYVLSSLNPNRNLPVSWNNIHSTIRTKEQLEQFEKLDIVQQVGQLEKNFDELSASILSFKDDDIANHVDKLIETNNVIVKELDVLQKHQELGNTISQLKQENQTLDAEAKAVLKSLLSFRAELKKLPKMPHDRTHETELKEPVDIQEVLKYAMKLSKFTRAPPVVAAHPNNYVWPAEDALRRGMLALASLKSDEIIKSELGEEIPVEIAKEEPKKQESPKPRKGSFGAYGTETAQVQPKAPLDLDLFDPDADSDSD